MKKQIQNPCIGFPFTSLACQSERMHQRRLLHVPSSQQNANSSSNGPLQLKQMRLGPRITEAVKRRLRFGAKLLRVGGVENIFKHNFRVGLGEKLLKASQCYISTTAGPIGGLLFISSKKVAFCSDKSIKYSSPTGQILRIRYKQAILRHDE